MITKYREQFNQAFSEESYNKVKDLIKEKTGQSTGFKLSETPIFLPYSFREKLLYATESILYQIKKIPNEVWQKAVPKDCYVPNDTDKPHFLCIDFAICKSGEGKPIPQLIELQAFPSLFGFQDFYKDINFEVYPFLQELKSQMDPDIHQQLMKDVIVGDVNPENVIILEINPEQQKTKIDFKITEDLLGIKTICLSKIKKQGKELFYEHNGELVKIKRIYNRVIFDELLKLDNFHTEFDFRDEVDVEWITHPNWFFKISKYTLPYLEHTYIPNSYFAHQFPEDKDLQDYVLKPLFSFAGTGVNLHPTKEIIDNLSDPENYILQKKVEYAKIFKDINGEFSKAEIRLLFMWKPEDEFPTYVTNLVRMTKSEMANIAYNDTHIWTGSSFALFVK